MADQGVARDLRDPGGSRALIACSSAADSTLFRTWIIAAPVAAV
jgi:hypothetical protein